jgi:hypothetical protein
MSTNIMSERTEVGRVIPNAPVMPVNFPTARRIKDNPPYLTGGLS